jgi:hypothetical protein
MKTLILWFIQLAGLTFHVCDTIIGIGPAGEQSKDRTSILHQQMNMPYVEHATLLAGRTCPDKRITESLLPRPVYVEEHSTIFSKALL